MMEYFKIANWSKYQHYKNRRPPWIKLYNKLLRKYEFLCLQDDSKLLLILLWLYASTIETENNEDLTIPNDPYFLKSVLPVNEVPDLQPLLAKGFIEMIATCKQDDSNLLQKTPPKIHKAETDNTDNTDSRFELFWKIYPKKIGKGAALKSFNKIRPSKELLERMIDAVSRQTKSAMWKKENGQFIPNPATWLNQTRWEDEIEVAVAKSVVARRCPECSRPLNSSGDCFCGYGLKLA